MLPPGLGAAQARLRPYNETMAMSRPVLWGGFAVVMGAVAALWHGGQTMTSTQKAPPGQADRAGIAVVGRERTAG